MTHPSGDRKLLLGALAGFLGSIAGLILVYLVSVVVIFVKAQDLFATALAAVAYLPLMLIIVFLLPNLALAVLIGMLLGAMRHQTGILFSFAAAILIGFILTEVTLSFILPMVIPPEPGDFVSILSDPYLTGSYGVVLGVLTNSFFRWFNPRRKLA
jgi:hypothetical protein